jgi:hypothetical protein
MTKREMVLEIYDREAMGEVSAREIGLIQAGLVARFGEGGTMSPAEIARVLIDEELPVRMPEIIRLGHPFDRYEELFSGLAFPRNLTEAEASLGVIDARHREFIRSGDRTGIRYARQTAQRARQNALTRVAGQTRPERERLIYEEIARWFTIWLQTPDVFPAWLELRKRRPELRDLLQP